MALRAVVFAAFMLATATTSLAQPKPPLGRFVVDLRGASAALPTVEGWTPVVPAGTVAPSRSLGIEVAAHVYPLRLRLLAIGLGASWLVAGGTTRPAPLTTGTTPATPALPELTTRLRSFAPQLSLNFGHALGWSYLSAGLGQSTVTSEASAVSVVALPARLEAEGVKTLNFGGGARWFINDHLGVGFDLRWHKLSLVAASATHPGAPRASLLTAGVGISVK